MATRRISAFVVAVAVSVSWIACDSSMQLTEDQKLGKQMYESLCDKCHQLIEPRSLNDRAWTAAAQKYGAQLKLTREEISLIEDYLTRANDTETKD